MTRPAVAAVGVLLVAAVVGCGAPDDLRAEVRASDASLQRFADNADRGIHGLATAFRRVNREVAALRMAEEVRGRSRVAEVDGATLDYVSAADAADVAQLYADALEMIDQDVDEVLEGWTRAKLDLRDSLDLRRNLRQWLEREGVRAEHFEAAERAITRTLDQEAGR